MWRLIVWFLKYTTGVFLFSWKHFVLFCFLLVSHFSLLHNIFFLFYSKLKQEIPHHTLVKPIYGGNYDFIIFFRISKLFDWWDSQKLKTCFFVLTGGKPRKQSQVRLGDSGRLLSSALPLRLLNFFRVPVKTLSLVLVVTYVERIHVKLTVLNPVKTLQMIMHHTRTIQDS